jgi:hypothetical protein
MNASTISDERLILSPFDLREVLTLKQAAAIAGKSEATMRSWSEWYGLGRRVGGGTWAVSRIALAMHLDGNRKALRAYHAGKRTDPDVVRYFEQEGLGVLLGSRP